MVGFNRPLDFPEIGLASEEAKLNDTAKPSTSRAHPPVSCARVMLSSGLTICRALLASEGSLRIEPSDHRLEPADHPAWVKYCDGRALACCNLATAQLTATKVSN